MTVSGTRAYQGQAGLPAAVAAAVALATDMGFDLSCLPEHGELLRVLARGVARAARLFHGRPNIEVLSADWRRLREHGPFDLLVLDDFGPLTAWPPRFGADVDRARLHWLEHPRLRATQVRLTSQYATLLATYVG